MLVPVSLESAPLWINSGHPSPYPLIDKSNQSTPLISHVCFYYVWPDLTPKGYVYHSKSLHTNKLEGGNSITDVRIVTCRFVMVGPYVPISDDMN